ncbi:GtrA family protein [Pelagibacterium luteolum]|uniref:Putative flippase GtrA (Transmembrane translocase of bactoprenol-linked glucose) n=1 Tax=Pelagibacterium luteolum TaxID=440168 RepID=A0A1G7XVS0_9HYPH|nr:GtrA family protein [Pelagibacterium luteolum]SDG88254.1 Putative flippase GtrA (transmembrane translocase of bactoprenol-linked glucose) [Pelagibacterium luteolum]
MPAKRPLPFAALFDGSFLRFFGASLFGLALDLALAAALHHLLGLSLIASAAVSLLAAAVLTYGIHEFWTFNSNAPRFSIARMAGTVASALMALAVRSSFLYATTEFVGLGERHALVQLVAATGLSFIVNYVLVRRIIGGRTTPGTTT